jgi:hypothetical protein
MTFQSLEAEAKQLVASIVSDAETVAGDIQSALNSPVISPFVAQLETGLTAVLTKAGFPAAEIESLGAEILHVLNGVGQQAAKVTVKAAKKAGKKK